jgi:hypothetical protein
LRNIQETFKGVEHLEGHSGKIQGAFREHSREWSTLRNIQGTFKEVKHLEKHVGNIQGNGAP